MSLDNYHKKEIDKLFDQLKSPLDFENSKKIEDKIWDLWTTHPSEIKLTKLLNKEAILIESRNAGWKFTCRNNNIDIETGLYFGIKNKYLENKNIVIIGSTEREDQNIMWEISKV